MPVAPDKYEVDPFNSASLAANTIVNDLDSGNVDDPLSFIEATLRAAAQLMSAAAAQFDLVESDVKAERIEAILTFFYRYSQAYDAADASRKEVSKKFEFMKNNMVPEAMLDAEVKSITVKIEGLPKRFTVNQRVSCSMTDREAAMQWLRDNGHEGLISETVNSSSLSAFAKNYAEETGLELPEAFKISPMQYMSVTKA